MRSNVHALCNLGKQPYRFSSKHYARLSLQEFIVYGTEGNA